LICNQATSDQRFNRWRKPPTADTILRHVERFPDANVGLVCSASNLVVIDIDTPDQVGRVEELFGASPLVVNTPSGGSHRYFRNPENIGCTNLRPAGLNVDIKGQGGIVACPPSVSRASGNAYTFRDGDWDRLADLPALSRSRVEAISYRLDTSTHRASLNPRGTRNNRLFGHLRALGPWMSLDEILSEARHYNLTQNEEPEADSKIVATARQVWSYQERGTLRTPSGYIKIDAADLGALKASAGRDYPTAVALLIELRCQHGARSGRGETFVLAATAMGQACVVPGVKDRRRIERARLALERAGLIEQIAPSGRSRDGRVHAATYRLRRRGLIPPSM
jgi:hypothetical protein